MVNSVSSTTPVNTQPNKKIGAMDKLTQEQLAHPGYYVVSPIKGLYEVKEPEYKKKGGFLKFLGKVLLTAVVVCGGAIAIRKGFMSEYVVKESFSPGTSPASKFKNWFAKTADKLFDNTIGKFMKSSENAKANNQKQTDAPSQNAEQGTNKTSKTDNDKSN